MAGLDRQIRKIMTLEREGFLTPRRIPAAKVPIITFRDMHPCAMAKRAQFDGTLT